MGATKMFLCCFDISSWCYCLPSVPELLHAFCPILKGMKNRKHSPYDSSSSERRTCFPTHYVFDECYSAIRIVLRCPNVSARKLSEITCSVLAVAYSFSGLALFPVYKT